MAMTCDNADNNVTMINELTSLIPGYRGNDMRVRCFGHVLNLIVKACVYPPLFGAAATVNLSFVGNPLPILPDARVQEEKQACEHRIRCGAR